MHYLKLYYLLIPLLLLTTLCHAQSVTIVKGLILDDSTGEALPFSTISYPWNGMNTMSNNEGEFIFKIRSPHNNDSIHISHVGYHAITIPIQQGKTLTVRLRQKPIQLSDAIVSGINPLDILKKAISKIPDNYAVNPYLLNGFYRLTARNDNQIIELTEAVFDIFGRDYSTKDQQFKLIKSRVDKDWNAFGWNGFELVRRPQGIIAADLVGRIHQSEILGDKGMPEHEFTYQGIIDYEGRQAYEITFDQRSNVPKADHRGTILIDTANFAFLSIARSLSPRGMQYWHITSKIDLDVLDSEQMQQIIHSDSVIITYRPYGGRYYLHYYYRQVVGRLTGGKVGTIDLNPYIMETNYLVTRIDTAGVKPFSEQELIPSDVSIERHASRTQLSDPFWENYNLIEADFNVDSTVNAIRQHNQTRQ